MTVVDRRFYEIKELLNQFVSLLVSRGVGTLMRLRGPPPTRCHHGWRERKKFLKCEDSRSLEMAISEF